MAAWEREPALGDMTDEKFPNQQPVWGIKEVYPGHRQGL